MLPVSPVSPVVVAAELVASPVASTVVVGTLVVDGSPLVGAGSPLLSPAELGSLAELVDSPVALVLPEPQAARRTSKSGGLRITGR